MHKYAAKRIPSTSLRTSLLSSFCLLLLISCSSPTPEAIPPTEPPVLPSATAAISAPSETAFPTETLIPSSTPIPQPELERPQYVMDVQLNYSSKAATVNQTITYPNWSGETLTNLVLAV